jgi:hypothetical protein
MAQPDPQHPCDRRRCTNASDSSGTGLAHRVMAGRRGFRVTGEDDGRWLRVLDPVVATEARSYEADGGVQIAVSDPLDIAGGVFSLSVAMARPK